MKCVAGRGVDACVGAGGTLGFAFHGAASEWRVYSRTTQDSPTNELQAKQSLMTASWQSAETNVQQHKVACLA